VRHDFLYQTSGATQLQNTIVQNAQAYSPVARHVKIAHS
jgi:hypothetical protein